MKIDCGPTPHERHRAKELWHRWFAWRPVRLGSHDCRWLETVERRGNYQPGYDGGYWTWEYRAVRP